MPFVISGLKVYPYGSGFLWLYLKKLFTVVSDGKQFSRVAYVSFHLNFLYVFALFGASLSLSKLNVGNGYWVSIRADIDGFQIRHDSFCTYLLNE